MLKTPRIIERIKAYWAQQEAEAAGKDPLVQAWLGEDRMPSVGDSRDPLPTSEDLADIGPNDPAPIPGQRLGRHRGKPFGEAS